MGPFQGKLKYTPNGLFMRLLINASLHTHPVLINRTDIQSITKYFVEYHDIVFYFAKT